VVQQKAGHPFTDVRLICYAGGSYLRGVPSNLDS
jgi:hypothetical protein